MTFYRLLVHLHSITRWLLLIGILFSIFFAIYYYVSRKGTAKGIKKLQSLTATLAHIQLLLGLILYFISPKVIFNAQTMKYASSRFYAMEHISMMIIAIALITIGSMRAKRAGTEKKYFWSIFLFYFLALLVILSAIPWPGGKIPGGWF